MPVGKEAQGELHEAEPLKLVEVCIETSLGARYVFPDMAETALAHVFASGLATFENITLVNASGAVLVVPTRIIRSFTVNDVILWKAL